MAKQVRCGKPSSTVTTEGSYLRHMLYTIPRNRQGQEMAFPMCLLCFIYSHCWRGVCLSAKQHRCLKQPGVSPSITAAGSEEQQGRSKARGDALNRRVLCWAQALWQRWLLQQGSLCPLDSTAPRPGREGDSPAGGTALLLCADRTLRAEVAASDTKGYWLVTA